MLITNLSHLDFPWDRTGPRFGFWLAGCAGRELLCHRVQAQLRETAAASLAAIPGGGGGTGTAAIAEN